MQVRKENHFENNPVTRGVSSWLSSSGDFGGRKPQRLGVKEPDVGSGVLCFEGENIRRSPAEELILKEHFFPPIKKKKTDEEEFQYGSYGCCHCEDGTICLVTYKGQATHIKIPMVIESVPVTALATNLFKDHAELQSVLMPDSIERAGNHVFDGCVNLREVRLSAALAHMDPTLFVRCFALLDVTFSAPFIRLEGNLFSDAPVARVSFGPLVEALDAKPSGLSRVRQIFVDARNKHFATDGKALLSVDRRHFYRLVVPCVSYKVPEGCIDIDERAFDSFSGLKEVTLPASLRRIGRLAFAKTALSLVHIPSSVTFIGEKTFYHCVNLTQVFLPPTLKEIGVEAFAFSAIRRIELPPALERLGFRAFGHTPAQTRIGEGALCISENNRHLDLDNQGGLYSHDVFVELIGQVGSYRVRRGTHAIGDEAFKRHAIVRFVEVPEGVFSLGREAFRGNRQLRRVDLPESLERIGERAFLDTALETLRLSKNVRIIKEDALLVQGDNQLRPRTPLRSISLDASNPMFYKENGLLCQRDDGRAGGDLCLLYVGANDVVKIPNQVTRIARFAFCGAEGIQELSVHGHMASICAAAFSTAHSIPLIHVGFPELIDGYCSGDFLIPELSARYQSLSYLLDAGAVGTLFDFEYYDSWVTHTVDIEKFAPAALSRLVRPMRLSEHSRELYENIFLRKSKRICRYFAEKGNLEALEWLSNRGLLDGASREAELAASSREGRTQATACLLELQHRCESTVGMDFSL